MEENKERPIDRIKEYATWLIDKKAIPSLTAFEVSAGLSKLYVKNLSNTEKGNPGVDAVVKIYKTFPGVSLQWLILGEGEMLTKPEKEVIASAKEATAQYKVVLSVHRYLKKIDKDKLIDIINNI